MSFIPGEQSDIASVASLNGSGINVATAGDIDYISTNLIAGAGIALTPSLISTGLTISSTGGGGGIASVSSGVGSGITATTVGSATTLTSALVAGTGISLVPAGVGTNLTINNTNTLSSANGSGITLTPSGGNTAITTNIVAGSGIAITPSGLNSSITLSTTGGSAPITSFVFSDPGLSINPIGGNTTSATSFTPPTTGMYILQFSASFDNNSGATPVVLDPTSEFSFQFNSPTPFPLIVKTCDLGPITTLIGGSSSFAQYYRQINAVLLASRTYRLNVNLDNNPSTTTTWGSCSVGLDIIKLC